MAKESQVTRTLNTVTVKVLCYNNNSGETYVDEIVLPRPFTSEKKFLAKRSTDEVTAVRVLEVSEIVPKLYGMSEEEFFETAHEIKFEETEEVEAQ